MLASARQLRLSLAGLLIATGALGFLAGPASGRSPGSSVLKVLPDVPVTAQDLRMAAANNSPELAVDPVNASFVVMASRIDAPAFSCALEVSVDGGRRWAPADPVPTLPTGAQRCYAPQVAFGPGGRLYYLFAGLAGAGNAPMGEFLTTSSNYARSFSTPVKVLGPERYMVAMAIDRSYGAEGRLHLVWVASAGPAPLGGFAPTDNPILADYSDNGGTRFSTPVQVSDPGRSRVVAPALVLGPDHSVDVAYYDLGTDVRDYEGLAGPTWPGTWSLILARSTNAGQSFGTGQVIDDQIVPPGRVMLIYTMAPPALAVDTQGRIFVAWTGARHGSPDVLFRRSVDDGKSWGPLVRINDDPLSDHSTHYLPHLSVASNGRVDALWLDRRNDPKHIRNDTYYANSTNAGVSFGPNVRLSAMSSNSRVGQRYTVPSAKGLVEFGSRLGLVSTDTGVLAAWPDTSNSIGAREQSIVSTEVELPAGSGLSDATWALIAAGLAVLVLAGSALVVRHKRGRRSAPFAADGAPGHSRQIQVAVVLLLAAGLTGGLVAAFVPGSTVATPERVSVVDVKMVDNAFDYKAPSMAGRVIFSVHNAGHRPHQLSLEELPANFPLTISQQLHGKVRRAFPAIGYIPNLAPGQSDTFAADLSPGLYAIVSFTRSSSGAIDALKGMASQFRIR